MISTKTDEFIQKIQANEWQLIKSPISLKPGGLTYFVIPRNPWCVTHFFTRGFLENFGLTSEEYRDILVELMALGFTYLPGTDPNTVHLGIDEEKWFKEGVKRMPFSFG